MIKEYADEGTAIEAMWRLIKLIQTKEETTTELGERATKLSTIAFPEEVRENVTIQVQLADLFVDALGNKPIRHDMIKGSPIRLSVAINLTKDSEKVWAKTRNSGTRVQGREETGGRKQ